MGLLLNKITQSLKMYGLMECDMDDEDVIDVPIGQCPVCCKNFYVMYSVCFEYHCHTCGLGKSFDLQDFHKFCRSRNYYVPEPIRYDQVLECPKCGKRYSTYYPEEFLKHVDCCTT